MATNRRVVTAEQVDIYATPAWATHALMKNEKFEGSICEPACGDGAMCEVLLQYNKDVIASDLFDHGYGYTGEDFLDLSPDTQYDNVITNPPYNIADKFVLKALQTAKKKTAMLVRLAYLEGQTRFKTIYNVNPPSRVWVFSERITFYKKGAKVKGSGTTAYCWAVWDSEDTSGKTELKWLAPIYKPNTKLRK